AGHEPEVEALGEADWVALSQRGLEPVRAGRFFIHTRAWRGAAPPGAVAIEIDAGRAFGTGHHETTAGCLAALDRLNESGLSFGNVLDLGTGTGVLAFATLRLWPLARAAASDADPVAVQVAADNAAANRIVLGSGRGELELIAASGMQHPRLAARAPFDLVLANILAGPLITLAPAVAAAIEPDGRLVLAGLLADQADAVAAAYRRQGMAPAFRIDRGEWPTLVMRRRSARASR
ncbi:MAG: 50S ribosomal protein L11 methyltransferase, partial [Pseudomonadota bacterium]|nr:50S ribosomal protein L11 methyltransferase [Pseudomonadota bacterium]